MLLVKDDLYVKKINRIMVAMDSSEAAIQCLQLALFLLRDTKGSELILVHVKIWWQIWSSSSAGEKTPFSHLRSQAKQGVQPRCITSSKPGEEILGRTDECRHVNAGFSDRRPSIAKSFVDLDRLGSFFVGLR